jgi:hypothetical protein
MGNRSVGTLQSGGRREITGRRWAGRVVTDRPRPEPSLVTSRPGAPSGEFDVITDGVNNDCHEQMTTLLIPTTTQ